MIVFKFGGASVKSADAVRNVGEILERFPEEQIAIVVSAMGKTTNAMELIVDHYFHKRGNELKDAVKERRDYHLDIITGLFPDRKHPFHGEFEQLFGELEERLEKPPTMNYDYDYDQIVPFGEIHADFVLRGQVA